jgi:hypothetical protein
MKSLKNIALIVALCGGLTSFASASITLVETFESEGQINNEGGTLAHFQEVSGHQDAEACIERVDVLDFDSNGVFTSGAFTFTLNDTAAGQTVTIDFDLTGSGDVLCGISVKGGTQANLYVIPEDQGTSGSFEVNAPLNPKSGTFFGISHIDVFCCPGGGNGVPDSGTTAMLLGSALTGLGLVRRYLKR